MLRIITTILTIVLFVSCKSTQKVSRSTIPADSTAVSSVYESIRETVPYRASATKLHDIIHTKLDISFDMSKKEVIGKAWIKAKPYFYNSNQLVLDAKGFDIHAIALVEGSKLTPLSFEYKDSSSLIIEMDRTYTKAESFTVHIDYTAKPEKRRLNGGSKAISSDKGMFFIESIPYNVNQPIQQIWTQGETEHNSCWFPTIDRPNEKSTQEIAITIPSIYKSLSNGVLVSSQENNNGTRTDNWVMNMPHAHYLFMVAVGDYAIIEDQWKDIPLYYYVEPAYAADAKTIFPHTPEMLSFFSEKLQYEYPWPKYAQIIVKDFVSGAMENTTAVTFQEGFQKTTRELIDETENERVVAHEMFHHWFGDLVTCESWSNLPLNEAFANYSEYLWFENKHGKEEADYHLLGELQGYLSTDLGDLHPLIDYGYLDKEDMFDSHSYNKGGCILHMLRQEIGDEAFWASLNLYLNEHEFTDVESDELRMAFEEVTGRDLNWFFDQWFLDKGHPQLEVSSEYNYDDKKVYLTITQTQDPTYHRALFTLPLSVDVYTENGVTTHEILIDEINETFIIPCENEPKLVNVDAKNILVGTIDQHFIDEQWSYLFANSKMYRDKIEALEGLESSVSSIAYTTLIEALKDAHWSVREHAISGLMASDNIEPIVSTLQKLARQDPHSAVRTAAFDALAMLDDPSNIEIARECLAKEQAYPVIGSAFALLASQSPEEAQQLIPALSNIKNSNILTAIGTIFYTNKATDRVEFFEENAKYIEGVSNFDFFQAYAVLCQLHSPQQAKKSYDVMHILSSDMNTGGYQRYATMSTLNELRNLAMEKSDLASDPAIKESSIAEYKYIDNLIQDIKSKETNPQLKRFYENY